MTDKKPDILFVTSSFPKLSETFILNQITEMIRRGYNIWILAEKRAPKPYHQVVYEYRLLEKTSFVSKIKVNLRVIINIRIWLGLIRSIVLASMWRRKYIRRYLRYAAFFGARRFDIVHAHFGRNGAICGEMKRIGLLGNAKLITSFHGHDMHFASGVSWYVDFFQYGDYFVVNSDYSRKLLLDIGSPENKIVKIPVGFNSKILEIKPVKTERFTILFIGRLVRLKGAEILLEACRKLKDAGLDFQCIIVGDGPLRRHIADKINSFDLAMQLRLHGVATQEEIFSLFAKTDVFVLPSIVDNGVTETQGLVVQEAQAAQVPVVVSSAGGIPEGIIDEVTGYVTPWGDAAALAARLLELANSPEKRKIMGQNGRKFAEKHFSNAVLGDKLEKLYNTVAK